MGTMYRLAVNIFFSIIFSFLFAYLSFFNFSYIVQSPLFLSCTTFSFCLLASFLVCELFSISKYSLRKKFKIKRSKISKIALNIAKETANLCRKQENASLENDLPFNQLNQNSYKNEQTKILIISNLSTKCTIQSLKELFSNKIKNPEIQLRLKKDNKQIKKKTAYIKVPTKMVDSFINDFDNTLIDGKKIHVFEKKDEL